MRWRVFYTRPRAEKRVQSRLAAAGHQVLLPIRTVLRQWSDRKQQVSEPLFPGYLFARVDERARLEVLGDEGVVRCLSIGGQPIEVPDREIDALQALQAVPDKVEAAARLAAPVGADVMIRSGPLKGVRGRVQGHPRPLYLLVELPSIRQAVRVHVPADWVMRT